MSWRTSEFSVDGTLINPWRRPQQRRVQQWCVAAAAACQWSHWARIKVWAVRPRSASQSLSDGAINGAVKDALIMSGMSCLATRQINLLVPFGPSPTLSVRTWWVNYGCKPGRQCDHLHNVRVGGHTAGSRRSVTDPSRYTSAQAYCPLVACWRHQRIWVRHTLFASLYDRRLPRSEPKPKKKLNFWFFAKNRAKPNRVWKYQNRNKPNRVGCSERAVLYFYRVVV